MSGDALLIANARTLLGVSTPLTPQALSSAFRVAVKAARPDLPGGDVERFRQVIDAYHLLQNQPLALPAPQAPTAFIAPPLPRPTLNLTPIQALSGSVARIKSGDKTFEINIPPGLRTNDRIRLKAKNPDQKDIILSVLIRPADGLTALGADLFMELQIPYRLIRDGGRLEIQTHAGPRQAWLGPDNPSPLRVCLKGLGLPAQGDRPAGDLFVLLDPVIEEPSAAKDMLRRFTQVWTPSPLAA